MRVAKDPVAVASGTETIFDIFDVTGRRVRSLPTAGGASTYWDGRDEAGTQLSSGVYFIRAAGAEALPPHRVVLMR